MRFVVSFLFIFFLSLNGLSQQYKVSGYVKDGQTGQALPGVSVYIDELKQGAATDENGLYSFSVPAGNYHLHASLLSYKDAIIPLKVNKDIKVDLVIVTNSINAKEVNVVSQRANSNVESAKMGTITLQAEDLKTIPVFFGEQDILKVIQLLPGIQKVREMPIPVSMFVVEVPTRILFCLTVHLYIMQVTCLGSSLFLIPMHLVQYRL